MSPIHQPPLRPHRGLPVHQDRALGAVLSRRHFLTRTVAEGRRSGRSAPSPDPDNSAKRSPPKPKTRPFGSGKLRSAVSIVVVDTMVPDAKGRIRSLRKPPPTATRSLGWPSPGHDSEPEFKLEIPGGTFGQSDDAAISPNSASAAQQAHRAAREGGSGCKCGRQARPVSTAKWDSDGVSQALPPTSSVSQSPPRRHLITEPSQGMPEACSTQSLKPFPVKARRHRIIQSKAAREDSVRLPAEGTLSPGTFGEQPKCTSSSRRRHRA